MTVNSIVSQQTTDGLGTIRQLLALDPKTIAAAHEEARKQMALTEEEEAKLKAARDLIANQPRITADLEAQTNALSVAKEQLSQAQKDLSDKRSKLDQDAETLRLKISTHATNERLLAEGQKKLEADQKANDAYKSSNDAEKKRLADVEKALNARADKMREAAK